MLLDLQELISSKLPYQDLRICGVYFLFDCKELVYVGSSEDCTTRLRNHEKDKTFDSYFIIEMAPVYIRDVEQKYINEFNPWYNKTVKRIKVKPIIVESKPKINRQSLSNDEENECLVNDLEYWTDEELEQLLDSKGKPTEEYTFYKDIMKERLAMDDFFVYTEAG